MYYQHTLVHYQKVIIRLNKKIKEKECIACPVAVCEYNLYMRGVDLLDAHLARYRIALRSRKWYLKIFYHMRHGLCECLVMLKEKETRIK